MERAKDIITKAKDEVKKATPEAVDKLIPRKSPLVSLRETLLSEGYDDKRGRRQWRPLLGCAQNCVN